MLTSTYHAIFVPMAIAAGFLFIGVLALLAIKLDAKEVNDE